MKFLLFIFIVFSLQYWNLSECYEEPRFSRQIDLTKPLTMNKVWPDDEETSPKWFKYSKDRLDKILNRRLNGNVAKNIIFFIGDGMVTLFIQLVFFQLNKFDF
jgi:hypothetical protein